jgi:hypothetical protein
MDFLLILRSRLFAELLKISLAPHSFLRPDPVDLLIRRLKRLQINLASKLCGAKLILSNSAKSITHLIAISLLASCKKLHIGDYALTHPLAT